MFIQHSSCRFVRSFVNKKYSILPMAWHTGWFDFIRCSRSFGKPSFVNFIDEYTECDSELDHFVSCCCDDISKPNTYMPSGIMIFSILNHFFSKRATERSISKNIGMQSVPSIKKIYKFIFTYPLRTTTSPPKKQMASAKVGHRHIQIYNED